MEQIEHWIKRTPEQRGKRKSPSAELIAWTPHPFSVIYHLFQYNKFGGPKKGPRASDHQVDFVIDLLKENWCALTEAATFTWQFVLPRSLHAQLRAHRSWSFFSESHRQSAPVDFADDGDYFKIPASSLKVAMAETIAMRKIQSAYRELLNLGCNPGLARGVLPMHINLGLAGTCSLRTLFMTVLRRNCDILQGVYWQPLLAQMKQELMNKVDKRFSQLFEYRPCDVFGKCQSPIEQSYRINKVDPHEPCSIYMRRFYRGDS